MKILGLSNREAVSVIAGAVCGASIGALLFFCNGCGFLHGNGRGTLVLGYSKTVNTFSFGTNGVETAKTSSADGKSYGNGNIAIAMDVQAIVSKGSGNSNNVSPELTVPAAAF